MPFVPSQKQVDSLYMLLTQLVRERIEIRIIRFINWVKKEDLNHCEIEIVCLEDEDKYTIYSGGKIKQK